MTVKKENIEPLLKRARVKDNRLNFEAVASFLDSHEDFALDDVLEKLEDEGIEVVDSTSGGRRNNKFQNSLQIYMKEISEISLLDADEEIEFSRTIHEAREKIFELCDEYEIDDEELKKLVLKSENKDLIRDKLRERGVVNNQLSGFMQRLNRYKEEYRDAHSRMVEANLRLVVTIAKKYKHCGLSFSDLINEGNMGLMKAVDRYDYRKGFRFSTYAAWWIRQAVLRAISNKGRTIRLPVYMGDLVRKWQKKRSQLRQELGREPHMMEVADELDIDYEKATHIMRHSQAPTSLEAPVGDEDDAQLKDLIEAEDSRDAELDLEENLMKQRLWEAIDTELSEKERIVFIHRYGLQGKKEHTLEEVGEILDLTRERIRQIQKKALEKVRESPYGDELRNLLTGLTT
ncbi:MAG: sigma-70 family RNA polymerase sigma factor [bacterium]